MGRVYAIDPDLSKGERSGMGVRAFCHPIMPYFYDGAFRVEFDQDANEGLATIHGYLWCRELDNKKHSSMVADVFSNTPIKYTTRGYCRIRRKDGCCLDGTPGNDPNWVLDDRGRICPLVKPVQEFDGPAALIVDALVDFVE